MLRIVCRVFRMLCVPCELCVHLVSGVLSTLCVASAVSVMSVACAPYVLLKKFQSVIQGLQFLIRHSGIQVKAPRAVRNNYQSTLNKF